MESEELSKSLEGGSVESDSPLEKSNGGENSSPLSGNNEISEENKSHQDTQIENVCIFCQLNEDDEFKYGKLYRFEGNNNSRVITAHHYCLFFASGLSQQGSDNEGIQGFLANDIQKEVSRASRLKCSFCLKKGASVGCCIKKCRQCYHYPCGRENGSLFRFFDNFVSFCSTHRPSQEFSAAEAMNLSLVTCPVCLDEVPNEPGFNVLKTPCCHNTFLHRDCIQQQALASGYYFFRCPICNNQKEFRDEMRSFGIHVPEQDAAWEREEGAFQELYQRHNKCDIEDCLCPKGKEHSTSQGKWQIVLCDFCGSVGCHLECGRLERPSQDWACPSCRGMLSTDDTSGFLFESTPCKKKGRVRSAMKLKGKTPRAGIKNKKAKKSTGSFEVDTDTDSPSTSRDSITDDSEISRRGKKKKKKMKKMKKAKKDDKKKCKSSQPPTLTRADLSPVRSVLMGDGPKTPKLSPIWDSFVKGKKHGGKGFKRHVFGKNSSSKLKGGLVSLKALQSQKQKGLKGAGNGEGGKKIYQKTLAGNLVSASKQVGSSKNKAGKASWAEGGEGIQSEEPETSGGKKKVAKSQHAVIFQSQTKLFKRGCPMRVKEDMASVLMKRSLATVKGEIISNLPLVRLCKMTLADGDDVENVQAVNWKRALISTSQDISKKKESGSKESFKVHFSRMSMRKKSDQKIVPAPKKKSEQSVVRSTRSKINSEQLANDILGESAKNVLRAVLNQEKPVDLDSYLHHRLKSEEIREGENKCQEKDGFEANDLTVEAVCHIDEEKNGFVGTKRIEGSGMEPAKTQCLRSSSKSSSSLIKLSKDGTMELKEEQQTEIMTEAVSLSPSKVKNDVSEGNMIPPDSISEKEKVVLSSSQSAKSSPLKKSESIMKDTTIDVEYAKTSLQQVISDNVQKVPNIDVGTGVRSSPRLGSAVSVTGSTTKHKQAELEDGRSISEKVRNAPAQESPSDKVGIASSKSSLKNEDENTVMHEKGGGKSSFVPHSFLQVTGNSPQVEQKGSCLEKTSGMSNNILSYFTAEKLRSSPRLRSTEVQDNESRTTVDTPLNEKDKYQKKAPKWEQESSSIEKNSNSLKHDPCKALQVSPVKESMDITSTDSQSDGQEDVSIVAVFTNKNKIQKTSETKCHHVTHVDSKRQESCVVKRKAEQLSPKNEKRVVPQKLLKSKYKVRYEDVYKEEQKYSSKKVLKKDSCNEKISNKSVRHSKGGGTCRKRSESNGSEDIAILGVFKLGENKQKKAKIEVLSQSQTNEKRSTPLLRSEKKKRDKIVGRDVGQKSLKVTTGSENQKETAESSSSSVKGSSPKRSDILKQKSKKTLNDYFQTTDKKSHLVDSDVKRAMSSMDENAPTSSPVMKIKSNSLMDKSSPSLEANTNSPTVNTNLCSNTKPVVKTNTSMETDNAMVVRESPSSQTKLAEDVTFVGIFKSKDVKDGGRKQKHVQVACKHGCQRREADLPKTNRKMPSIAGKNISENVRKSATEIIQGGVRIESKQISNSQTPNKQSLAGRKNLQYALTSSYVSHTPSPQKRESSPIFRTAQYSWPLPKRESEVDTVILDVRNPNSRQSRSRSRLFSDSTEEKLKISKEVSLTSSSKRKHALSDNCNVEEETLTLAKQPSKRKCCEMDGVDAMTAESSQSPSKEKSNLNITKQWQDTKHVQNASLSGTEENMGKDAVSKRRSKRLKRDESSVIDIINLTDEDDIFPQSENQESQSRQMKDASMNHCSVAGKVHLKSSAKDSQTRQTTPQRRMLLQRPVSLCKVVEADTEGDVSRSTRRKCNSDLKVKKPVTVQKISRRQLVMS